MQFFSHRLIIPVTIFVFFFSTTSSSDPGSHQYCSAQHCFADNSPSAASKYFLTPEEILASRSNYPRKLNPYTLTGNRVRLLVDGKAFFESLAENLEATQSGDFIFMTGYEFNPNVILQPDCGGKDCRKSRIVDVLLRAIHRGVELRMLLDVNLLSMITHSGPIKVIELCHRLNVAAGKIVCAPDDRHHDHFGSLHQKAWAISRNNEVIAFVGSMDVDAGRYDTKKHDKDPATKSEPPFWKPIWGWTGGMLELKGEVARDVANHLYDQMTDPVNPFKFFTLARLEKPEFHVGHYTDSVQAQVLLTAGPMSSMDGYFSNWAPGGDLSVYRATIKAIQAAKRYIYLSEQFMWYPPIMNAIADRLNDLDHVILLTDSALTGEIYEQLFSHLHIDITLLSNIKFYYQGNAWSALNPDNPKVSAYQMVKEGKPAPPPPENIQNIIYTHWKVMIIDDEFAIIGSAGAGQAGMTNDVEMSIGLYDPPLVSHMRRQLWSEHLNVAEDDPRLQDPLHAIRQLWPEVANNNGRVREYWPKKVPYQSIYGALFKVMEPCGLLDQSKCQ